LAMMARFSFLFFQTKNWSANRVRLMTDLGGCEIPREAAKREF
jgi:hypothetical protein